MKDDFVLTTCPFCGCGCSFYLMVSDNRVVDVAPCFTDRVSAGKLCVKGRRAHEFVGSDQRLTQPLVRKNGKLAKASWEEALEKVVSGLAAIKESHSPDAIGLLSSAKCTNEENYLTQKLARTVLDTHNIDHCARL